MHRKPSIRNYAVLQRLETRPWGSVWTVQDRRSGSRGFLYKPSLLISWPRLYSAISSLNPIPLRLRNNHVVLLTSSTLSQKSKVAAKLWNPFIAVSLDPSGGLSGRKSVRFFGICCLLLALGAISLTSLTSQGISATTSNQITCGRTLKSGEKFQIANGKFKLAKELYEIQEVRAVGGYRLIQAKRKCDEKIVNLAAWYSGDFLEISKVY